MSPIGASAAKQRSPPKQITCDFRVTTATSAKEGLRFFRTHQVDAVVLDYEMPEMNGGQVAKKMKAMRRDVPVLILSALPWLPSDTPRECADAFITNGGPTRALVSELEQLMELRRRAPRAEEACGWRARCRA